MATSARSRPRLALAAGGSGGGGGGGDLERLREAIALLRQSRRELVEELRAEYATNRLASVDETTRTSASTIDSE